MLRMGGDGKVVGVSGGEGKGRWEVGGNELGG